MLPVIEAGGFVEAFLAKGRYHDFMSQIPIRILLNPKTAMIGAVHAAAEMLEA
jgi:glucokinase